MYAIKSQEGLFLGVSVSVTENGELDVQLGPNPFSSTIWVTMNKSKANYVIEHGATQLYGTVEEPRHCFREMLSVEELRTK